MTDLIRVTVAAGYTVTIDPHPSGIEGMPPLRLGAEQTLLVSREQARQLYEEGRIYHPETGLPKPKASAPPPRPLVSYGHSPGPIPGVHVVNLVPTDDAEFARRHNAEVDRRNAERQASGGMRPRQMVRQTGSVQTADDSTGIFAELAREMG